MIDAGGKGLAVAHPILVPATSRRRRQRGGGQLVGVLPRSGRDCGRYHARSSLPVRLGRYRNYNLECPIRPEPLQHHQSEMVTELSFFSPFRFRDEIVRTQSHLKSATAQHGYCVIGRPAIVHCPGFVCRARELPDKSCETNHLTEFTVAPTRRCQF